MTTQTDPDYNTALQDARKATLVAQTLADQYRAQLDHTRAELDRCKALIHAIRKAINDAQP